MKKTLRILAALGETVLSAIGIVIAYAVYVPFAVTKAIVNTKEFTKFYTMIYYYFKSL